MVISPYVDETFLVSGPASCILFNRAGEVLLQSPPTYWPRGVLVRSKTEVWLAGAVSLKRWDPDTNTCGPPLKSVIAPRGIHAGPALNREPPLQKKTPFTGRRIHGGAMFDIAWQDDEVPLHPLEEQPWYSDLLKDWEMESAVPDLATRIATHAVTLAAPGRATYLEGVVAMHPELTLELLNERVREMLTAWKEA